MASEGNDKFTVYLEGQEGHRGNVLLHAYITKIRRLTIVLGKMERAYLNAAQRQTDFEIIAAEKVNPTSLTLMVVPHVRNYNPRPAFDWTMKQIRAVGDGIEPDERVTADIADDLAELAARDRSDGYKSFWINGYAEKVQFDDRYHENAARLVARKRRETALADNWHVGKSIGTIVGVLKKLDDFEHDREFVIVPPVGDPVTCTFSDVMQEEMGKYWSKMVRVSGTLHYQADSPFPARVDVLDGGVELYPEKEPRRTLAEMRGVFAGMPKADLNWDSLLDGR